MVALPIITDTYRVTLLWSHSGGQTAANVIHIYKAASTPAAVAAALDSNVTTAMWSQTVSNASVKTLHVTKLDGVSATYVTSVSGAKWGGGGGAADFIPQASAVVSLRSAARGRSFRGRTYLPFIGEADVSNGTIVTDLVTSQTAWNAFLTAMTTAAFLPVIASYKLASQIAVTSYIYEALLGTQRRRMSRLR